MKLSRMLTILLVTGFVVGVVCVMVNSMRLIMSIWPELLAGGGFIVAGGSLPGAVCAAWLEQGRFRLLMWTGVVCACVVTIGWLAVFLVYSMTWEYSVGFVNLLALPSIYTFIIMVIGLLYGRRSRVPLYGFLAGVTMGSAIVASIFVALTVWTEGEIWRMLGRGTERYFLGSIILFGFGTLLSLVLQRLPQLSSGDDTDAEVVRVPLRLWCPRCGIDQVLQTGGATCSRCGLSISVKLP